MHEGILAAMEPGKSFREAAGWRSRAARRALVEACARFTHEFEGKQLNACHAHKSLLADAGLCDGEVVQIKVAELGEAAVKMTALKNALWGIFSVGREGDA